MKTIKEIDCPEEVKTILVKVNTQVLIAYTIGKQEGMKTVKDIFTK